MNGRSCASNRMFFFQLQQKKIFLADADSAATQKPRLHCKYGQAVMKKFDFRDLLKDSKSNCIPKISLIGWVLNSAFFCQLISFYKLSWKNFDFRNWLRNSKPNCIPKISLIDWVWNSALVWHIISCYELSSCPKNFLSS